MNKKELEFYIKADLMMNRGKFCFAWKERIKHIIRPDLIMDFLKAMRYCQYYQNKKNFWGGSMEISLQ